MAMTSRRVFRLNISHLKLVRDALKESHFIDADWFDLGVELNLPYPDLATIRDKWSNDPSQCLRECLSLWLRTSAISRAWESLASALESMRNHNTTATLIRNTFDDPASQIFQHYSNRISQVSLTDSCIQLLYTEGLINEDTQRKIERCGGSLSDTLKELMIAVSDDHSKLRSLGNILMKLDETKPLAQDIIKECDEIVDRSVTTAVVRPVTTSTVNHLPTANTSVSALDGELFVNAAHQSMFDEIRGSFGILIDEIIPLISQSIPSAAKMKSFLQLSFPELKDELSNADSIEAIMNVVVQKCRVNNISKLKTIVKRFKIAEAKPLISEYEEEVKTVCGSLKYFLSQNKPDHLDNYDTIQFTLGWEPDEHSLDDIRSLLEEAFKELNKRIIVQSIHRGNSIIVICYGPHHLLAALFLEVHYNLTVLMKGFSLIRLTIGHYTVYDKRIRYKVMNNECLAEEIKLADGDERELITLLDYKEGSIFEQDKKLNIIKKRKEYITRTLQTPESKLKVKLLTEGKLMNGIFKSKESDAQCFRKLITGRKEALVEYKKEIELLQEKISITSVQLLMTQKAKIEKKDQCTQSLDTPTAESIYTACIDYHGIWSGHLSFSEGEQLEIYDKSDSFYWKGRSLVSGDEGKIPSSYVYSMLESLQLLEFILSDEEVSLPTLQKIRNDSSSNDEKASLFLETINDDPNTILALRQEKEQHDKGDIELNLRPVRMTTDILKVKSASLTAAMSADPVRISDKLYAEELIPQQTKNEIHIAADSMYTKASKLMNAIEGQLAGLEGLDDSLYSRQYLINFCKVLINQHSRSPVDLAKSMLDELEDIELNLRPGRLTTDILKVKSASLTAVMSADPVRISDELYARELIPQQTKNEIHTAADSMYTKASKLMNAIEGQLEGLEGLDDSLYSRQYLINFCKVLINQYSRSLMDLAKSMLHELGDIEFNLQPGRMTTDILKVKSASLTAAMSANPVRISDELYAKELIPQQTKNEIRTAADSMYTKASKLMNAIEGRLEGLEGLDDSLYSRQYLINFCEVLINQHSRSLEDLAKSMLHELGLSTEESTSILLLESVRSYAGIMKRQYLEQPIITQDWMKRFGSEFFGRLGLVHKRKFNSQARDKKSSSKDDEIANLQGYTKIPIDNVLLPNDTNTVIIDGPPGIGKTTVCRNLLNMWANGKLAHLQYDLVLYCPLRNSKIAKATTLADLFEYNHRDVFEVVKWIENEDGKGLLIIFDGWDELSNELRKNSIPAELIHKKLLYDCSVIVTSRSYASHSLMKIPNNRHIQVIGFSKNEIFTVIIQTLQPNQDLAKELIDSAHCLEKDDAFLVSTHQEDSKLAVKLINELIVRSDVQSLCYVPLVCSIVILIYRIGIYEGNEPSLPETLTELYEKIIFYIIKRDVEVRPMYGIRSSEIDNIFSLPKQLAPSFQKLCKLAYTKLANTEITFPASELCDQWEREAVEDNLGLMTVCREFYKETYQFLHLSIQEFLAAWWIANNESAEDIFKNRFDDGHFQMCLRFLAGLTKLKGSSYREIYDSRLDITSKWKRFEMLKCQFSFFYHPSQDIKSETFMSDETIAADAERISLLLLQLLYESKNVQLYKVCAESVNRSMCLFEVGSTLFDVKCLFDFIQKADITWEHITLGYIFGYAFAGFYEGLERNSKTQCKELGLLSRYVTHNEMTYLPFLFSLYKVQALYFVSLDGSYDPSAAFSQMLLFSPQLKILHFTMCQTKIEQELGNPELILASNSTLQELKITYKGEYVITTTIISIIKGVTRNKSLRSFTLEVDCPHSNPSAVQIGTALETLFSENCKMEAISLNIPNYCLSSSLNVVNITPPLRALGIGRLNTKLLPLLQHVKGLDCLIVPYPEKFELTESLPCPDLQLLFTSHPNLQQLTIPLDTAQSAIKLFTTLMSNSTMKGLNIEIEDEIVFSKSMHSLEKMLTENQTLQFFEIVTPSCLTNNAPDIPIPTSFIFVLTAGLKENSGLKQLGIPVMLPINKHTERLFELVAEKSSLTELQFYFVPDESCINCSLEEKKEIMNSLFYEQVLPATSRILMSHRAIKLLRLQCEYLNDSTRPNWDEPAQEFCKAVYLHPSLEYIEIVGFHPPTCKGKMLLQNYLEESSSKFYKKRREQSLGSMPVVNMAKKHLQYLYT